MLNVNSKQANSNRSAVKPPKNQAGMKSKGKTKKKKNY
jgi:hypothetical protein